MGAMASVPSRTIREFTHASSPLRFTAPRSQPSPRPGDGFRRRIRRARPPPTIHGRFAQRRRADTAAAAAEAAAAAAAGLAPSPRSGRPASPPRWAVRAQLSSDALSTACCVSSDQHPGPRRPRLKLMTTITRSRPTTTPRARAPPLVEAAHALSERCTSCRRSRGARLLHRRGAQARRQRQDRASEAAAPATRAIAVDRTQPSSTAPRPPRALALEAGRRRAAGAPLDVNSAKGYAAHQVAARPAAAGRGGGAAADAGSSSSNTELSQLAPAVTDARARATRRSRHQARRRARCTRWRYRSTAPTRSSTPTARRCTRRGAAEGGLADAQQAIKADKTLQSLPALRSDIDGQRPGGGKESVQRLRACRAGSAASCGRCRSS